MSKENYKKNQDIVCDSLGIEKDDECAIQRIRDYNPFMDRLFELAVRQQECIQFLMELIEANKRS